jgi:hypothetical protein
MDKHAEFVELKYKTINHYKGGVALAERNLKELREEQAYVQEQIPRWEKFLEVVSAALPCLEAATTPEDRVAVYPEMEKYINQIKQT